MNRAFFIAILAANVNAFAGDETIDHKKRIAWGGFNWEAVSVTDANTVLTQQSIKACPSGFEKVREYAAPEGEAWYLHFVVRCITPPSTPVASAPAAPK